MLLIIFAIKATLSHGANPPDAIEGSIMTILVTGARGNIGSRVVTRLAAADCPVRATARDLTGLQVPDTVETARLDLTGTDGFDAALQGVETVFLYTARGDLGPLLGAARAAGVRHVVLLSSPAAYEAAEYRHPIGLVHRAAEQALADSGLDHTVLYPSWLAGNARRDWADRIRGGEPVELPYPAANYTPIHPDDVAAVAVELLRHDAHRSRFQILTGPESMRLDEIVAVIAEVLGRPIPVRQVSRHEAMEHRPPWLPAAILESLLDSAAAAVGAPATVTNTVERITGRRARSLHDWVTEHRAAFTG
jgi:uncharacterized protein YbjT (DUF2867 family)